MPSIFSGIRKISDSQLRLEIALLENVSVGNAMKETGSKALGMLAAFAGSIGEKLGMKPGNDSSSENSSSNAQDMLTNVDKRCVALSGLSRDNLELRFKNLLTEKCNEFWTANTESQDIGVSEDLLSITIINEAAKIYELDRNMTVALKADEICKRYDDQLLTSILKAIKAENGEAVTRREVSLQLALNEAPIEAKRNLQKRLVLEEFSGRGLYSVIKSSASIKKLRIVVECIGYGAFDINKAYIDAAFDTMFGVHRLKRAMFAHIVWLSVRNYGAKFAINQDLLPSYVPVDLRPSVEEEEREYMKQIAARKELQSSYEKSLIQVERYEKELASVMEIMTEEQDPVRVTQVKNNLDFAQNQFAEYKREYEGIAELIEKKTASKARQLELAWMAFFPRFVFEDKVFEKAVEKYTKAELLNLERMLKEMHDSIDIVAYSAKKIEFEEQLRDCALCTVSAGKSASIIYNGNRIFDV